MALTKRLRRLPVLGPSLQYMRSRLNKLLFHGSAPYWEERYRKGGNSGSGSYGRLALHKAEIINGIVEEFSIRSVIEFGCGDGNQLRLANYPIYHGFDVSASAIQRCQEQYSGRPEFVFSHVDEFSDQRADLSLSLDVIYHLVEDEIFESYMTKLFASSTKFVLIYACDFEDAKFNTHHIRTRRFSDWISAKSPDWKLVRHIANKYPYEDGDPDTSFADFYIYGRIPHIVD